MIREWEYFVFSFCRNENRCEREGKTYQCTDLYHMRFFLCFPLIYFPSLSHSFRLILYFYPIFYLHASIYFIRVEHKRWEWYFKLVKWSKLRNSVSQKICLMCENMSVEEILSNKKNNVSIYVCMTFSCFLWGEVGGKVKKKITQIFPNTAYHRWNEHTTNVTLWKHLIKNAG